MGADAPIPPVMIDTAAPRGALPAAEQKLIGKIQEILMARRASKNLMVLSVPHSCRIRYLKEALRQEILVIS